MKNICNNENIQLLIKEGINYLENKIELLDSDNKELKSIKFKEFIEKNVPLIGWEKIKKMSEDNQLSIYVKNIINTIDRLSLFISEKYGEAIKDKLVNSNEFKEVFNEYCNMINNNIELGELHEMFEEWCADGEIFYDKAEKKLISNHSAGVEVLLMKHYSEKLDEFTKELCQNIEKIEECINKEEENESR